MNYGLEHRPVGKRPICWHGRDRPQKRPCVHTQVHDIKDMRFLWTGPDRTQESLGAFFDELGQERCQKIEVVCCDMWAPYVEAIK